MDTIITGFICLYGTTGPFFSSAVSPEPWGLHEQRMENAGIEPATEQGVPTTKPFP